MSINDDEKLLRLYYALRWYNSARDDSDILDQFWKQWVALESLYRIGPNPATPWKLPPKTPPIVDALSDLYPPPAFDRAKIAATVEDVYGLRNRMFHAGERDDPRTAQLLQDLRGMLEELLRAEVGIPIQHKIAVRFTP